MFRLIVAAAIAFINADWVNPGDVVERIAFVTLKPNAAEARARVVFEGLRQGVVDRALFTDNGNAYLTAANLADQKAGLGPLGPARLITLQRESTRGGLRTRVWKIRAARAGLTAVERAYPDGRIEQFMVSKDAG
jgi:hypothetical protein